MQYKRASSLFIIVIICFSFLVSSSVKPAVSGEKKEPVKVKNSGLSKIDSIDIYSDDVYSFLDVDLKMIQAKATEAYQNKDYETATKYYLALCQLDRTQPVFIYNLSCCYGLLGDAEKSATFLKHAFNAGFQDMDFILKDPDFDKVRNEKVFSDLLVKMDEKIQENKDKKFESGTLVFVEAPGLFQCKVVLPPNYSSKKEYPLVIGMHGRGGNAQGFSTIFDNFDREFIYVCPQGPNPFVINNQLGYSWGLYGPEDLHLKGLEVVESYIATLTEKMKGQYKISDVYALGFSEGGGTSYVAALKNPDLFDGVMCFGGWLDEYLTDADLKSANHVKIFIAHGKNDRSCPYEWCTNAVSRLKKNGYDVTLYDFDGGHTLTEEALHRAVDWISH